jgi:hypothetical protein
MAGRIPNDLRDGAIAAFRAAVMARLGVTPFTHQREWMLASEGWELGEAASPGAGEPTTTVQLPDQTVETRLVRPRAAGPARFIADLGAFKVGKSFGAALWLSGFGAVPGARVGLVGSEYAICEPEFNYLCEFLLSAAGMGLKAESLQNRPRDGKLWLELPNGTKFEACSWERRESLKGKEIDAYCFCEAYQLPGIECFTSVSQNLRARRGFAIFPTTPDRPWVKILHELGHGADPEWHCTCGVPAEVNAHTFDATAKERDKTLMTREKYQIHYLGQIGEFVGSVYNFQRGQRVFDATSHPELFRPGAGSLAERFRVPPGWDVVSAGDTGTFYSAVSVAFSPDGEAFVVGEWPNYRYVAGQPERDEGVTIPGWSAEVVRGIERLGGRPQLWADKNSQFKRELVAYGITLLPSTLPLETRTEIAREYFQHHRIWLAPWLSVLPYELENAVWPEEATAAGKFARVKDRDHTLDGLEHILSRRPRGKGLAAIAPAQRWIDTFVAAHPKVVSGDPHLGRY